MPAGDGVWRVWRVLEGLERLESFGGFAGWQTAALKAHKKSHCCGPGPGGLEFCFGKFGAFAGWQTAALKFIKSLIAVALALGVWNFGGVWSLCGLANGSFESP